RRPREGVRYPKHYRSPRGCVMSPTQNTRTTDSRTLDSRTLGHIAGTVVLVGAGKMGAALLEGWLSLGFEPKNLVVLEPQPSRELTALAARGMRLNPKGAIGDA